MPREHSRTRRVAEVVRRELAELLAREVNDPRARLVTITAVQVSADLRHAKVFVTQLGEDQTRKKTVLESLKRASGFLRHRLGDHLDLKVVPDLQFFYDDSVERGVRLTDLIERSVRDDATRDNED